MSEEAQEATDVEIQVVENTDDSSSSLDEIEDIKTLRKMVKTLRQENGNHRQKNKTAEGELAEYRKWKESQLSELERERSAKEAAIARANQILVDKLAIEFGVDDEFKDFIVGTEDEMRERAKKLGSRSGDNTGESAVKARLLGGNRGSSIGKKNDGSNRDASTGSDAEWFSNLYKNAN